MRREYAQFAEGPRLTHQVRLAPSRVPAIRTRSDADADFYSLPLSVLSCTVGVADLIGSTRGGPFLLVSINLRKRAITEYTAVNERREGNRSCMNFDVCGIDELGH